MTTLALSGNASGAGTFTVLAPNSANTRTLTLPDATTTLVGTDATQTLTNKTIQGGAITSGTAVASTSGTSIDFTSIPSWVKRVTVMLNGVSTSGTSNIQIQIGAGSVATSGYVSAASSGNSASSSTAAFIVTGTVTAATNQSGIITLATLGSNVWVSSGNLAYSNASTTNVSGGNATLGGTLDRVRITTVNGTDTFDAGSINILYE